MCIQILDLPLKPYKAVAGIKWGDVYTVIGIGSSTYNLSRDQLFLEQLVKCVLQFPHIVLIRPEEPSP